MGMALLGGTPEELLLENAEFAGTKEGLHLWTAGDELAGSIHAVPGAGIEEATGRLYRQVFAAARGLNLYRMWNSVPRINGVDGDGLENYRGFCRGRSLAFESAFGRGFARSLPASTAVGCAGEEMTVVFLAGPNAPRHFENPAQVPAYRYPAEHGPRPPSFARATAVERAGRQDVFVSGTSSIVGHSTVSPHDTPGQLACTLENLRRVFAACGLQDGAGARGERHYKVYLRHPTELAAVARELEGSLIAPGDQVSYLEAEICRSELNVEIEAVVRGSARS